MSGWTQAPVAGTDTSGEDRINDLLSGNSETSQTDTAELTEGDTPVTGEDIATEEGAPEPEEGAEPEPEGEEPEGAETEEETEAEDELPEEELETDYSETAYARAAEHWKKRGVELDPKNEGHRALLRDWLDRGRDAREARARLEELDNEPEEEETPAKEQPATAEAKTPEQYMKETWDNSKKYAEETYNPEMSRDALVPFVTAVANIFWPGKGHGETIAKNITPEDIKALSLAIRPAISMELAMAMPSIFQGVPQMVTSAFPYLGEVHTSAMKERAVEELVGAMNEEGKPLYPNLEQLIENDTIRGIMNGPDLKDERGKPVVFSRDPYKNLVATVKAAYRIANNQRVDVKSVERAARRGREVEQARQRRVSAGRMSPGRSAAGTASASEPNSLKTALLGGTGSKFSRLLQTSQTQE